LFTLDEMLEMGIRQRAYWIRQADAIRRQLIAAIAFGVRIGMADSSGYEKGIANLEIGGSNKSHESDSKATWDMLFFLGGGKGV